MVRFITNSRCGIATWWKTKLNPNFYAYCFKLTGITILNEEILFNTRPIRTENNLIYYAGKKTIAHSLSLGTLQQMLCKLIDCHEEKYWSVLNEDKLGDSNNWATNQSVRGFFVVNEGVKCINLATGWFCRLVYRKRWVKSLVTNGFWK